MRTICGTIMVAVVTVTCAVGAPEDAGGKPE